MNAQTRTEAGKIREQLAALDARWDQVFDREDAEGQAEQSRMLRREQELRAALSDATARRIDSHHARLAAENRD